MLVKCDSKTCINYKNGMCNAESIEIKNHEFWDNDNKEYKDHEKCESYKYDKEWIK